MVGKEYLLKDYRKATGERFAPACMRPVKLEDDGVPKPETIVCYNCGVACDLDKIKQDKKAVHEGVLSTPPELVLEPAPPASPVRWRYRLAFRKAGTLIYLSHLDLVRTLTRALRRARVPLRLTQGFSPHPEVAFGPALALGVESRCEYLDFNTVRTVDAASLLQTLAATLPEGLSPLALVPISTHAPSLSAAVGGALYTVQMPLEGDNGRSTLRLATGSTDGEERARVMGIEEVRGAIEAFLAREQVFVERRKKDRRVAIEVRGSVLLLELQRREQELRLRLGLRMSPQGAVKPAEILRAALGATPASWSLRRDDLLIAEGGRWVTPLEGAGADTARAAVRREHPRIRMEELPGAATAPSSVPAGSPTGANAA
jgi:radical SAM-linked protein